jgi:hypothetical protein
MSQDIVHVEENVYLIDISDKHGIELRFKKIDSCEIYCTKEVEDQKLYVSGLAPSNTGEHFYIHGCE